MQAVADGNLNVKFLTNSLEFAKFISSQKNGVQYMVPVSKAGHIYMICMGPHKHICDCVLENRPY